MPGSKKTLKHSPARPAPTAAVAGGQEVRPHHLPKLLHDLNQPLSAINNYAQAGVQLIDNGLADSARMKDLFAKIVAQAARATALSQDMGKQLARGEHEQQP